MTTHRIATAIVVAVLVVLSMRWIASGDEDPKRAAPATRGQQAAAPPSPTATPTFPVPGRSEVQPLPESSAPPLPRPLTPPVAAPAPPQPASAPYGAAPGSAAIAPTAAAPADAKAKDPKEQGTLALTAWYAYAPPGHPSTDARMRVSVAGTLDCRDGVGDLHYRDGTQYVEWRAHHFTFDPASVCLAERDPAGLSFVNFNLAVKGAYAPRMLDPRSEVRGAGRFTLLFASNDPQGAPLAAMLLCLEFEGGAYARYELPQNTDFRSTFPRCTYITNFSLRRAS